ncbi:hypothetical protein RJ640_026314 [Escallonia rubra]|uniref:Uncharacterized protein n=1 Tax=Escallonia rubra TaxID=112253 RepID=A0AA88UHP5_9ASTE|nr:hypothetical protein RJ640_026314 [Escallonia rubra]
MKCVGLQYLEAIRKLKASGFQPIRTVYLSFVIAEEIGGHDGAEKFADSDTFTQMNVGIVLDERLASPNVLFRPLPYPAIFCQMEEYGNSATPVPSLF